MTFILCLMTSLLVILLILAPFLMGAGGQLSAHASVSNEESLTTMQKSLLNHYLKNEELFASAQLRKREWEQRQSFLTNRYLDVSRRLDGIRFQKGQHDGA